ncbi:Leucine aminopeptidase 2 [Pseudozyma hubeiensis]|nr:Leucine aminopeptidase 2 [Pseudozyma hubeiensis]
MTWTPPNPASVGAPALRVPEDIHTHAKPAEYKPVHLHLDWNIDWYARTISGRVSHVIELIKPGLTSIILDASYLKIHSVHVEGKSVDYNLGTQHGTLGAPLDIPIPSSISNKGDKVHVDIEYTTTERCTALGWLTREQTAGKTNPFLYSQCQAIHCRSLVPCIDSPSHKITYTATVKSRIPVLMSALKDDAKPDSPGTYHFKQPVGIPSYLIAIVGGDLEFRKLGERTGIWAEPPNADAVQWEFEADAERFLEHAEKVISPYSWTRYDSVVLPPSFPYGGMENANLTTLTPSLVCGDRSLTDVLLHELCHSWSGNLTSCANWTHFWLNEGWTVYLERLLLQDVHGPKEGPAHRGFSYIIGSKALKDALAQFTDTPRFQRLIPAFKGGEDPDDAFSSIPYEKGSNFLLYLERTVGGLDNFLPYAKSYFHAFYNRSVTTQEWREHLFKFFETNAEATAALHKVDWDAWFHGEGLELPVKMEYDTTLAEQAFSLAGRWIQVIDGHTTLESAKFGPTDIKGWNANQVVVFLERLHSGPKVPLVITQKLDEVYGFSKATNGEVLLRFFEVALEAKGGKYAQQAAEWVKGQGRMKFCRTVYRALNKVEPELAKKTFLDNKSFYHPIAAAQIEKDLALTNTVSLPPAPGVITIFGSTGTGKTKLSVELSLAIASDPARFGDYKGAEVISCDSMQIYRGLDIITNKATVEEMKGVPHHLIGFVDPEKEPEGGSYDVTRFVSDTNAIVEELRGRGKVGVVCGGTSYYLQHLMFPGRLIASKAEGEGEVDLTEDPLYQGLDEEQRDLLDQVEAGNSGKLDLAAKAAVDPTLSTKLWQVLERLDPSMAARWHHRDARKIANSLRVYKETGRPHSYWIAQQDSRSSNPSVTASPAPVEKRGVSGQRKLLFWLWCDPPTLRQRLDSRVDDMVRRGLESEVVEMRSIARTVLNDVVNYQSGIFQTIGYRQFADYLDRLSSLTSSSSRQKAFDKAVEDTKTSTRRYAKSQMKWVQNKLIPEVRRAQAAVGEGGEVELYLLDATDVDQWDEKVFAPALDVASRFLKEEELPNPATISNPAAAKEYLFGGRSANQALTKLGPAKSDKGEGELTIEANKLYTCQVCTSDPSHPVRVREVDRETHTKGRHHRNNVKRRTSNADKEAAIREKIEQGEQVRAARLALKEEEAAKKALSKQTDGDQRQGESEM